MDFDTFLRESAADSYLDDAQSHAKGTTEYNAAMAKFRDSVARSFAIKASKAKTIEGRKEEKDKAKLNRELRNDHERKSQ